MLTILDDDDILSKILKITLLKLSEPTAQRCIYNLIFIHLIAFFTKNPNTIYILLLRWDVYVKIVILIFRLIYYCTLIYNLSHKSFIEGR